MSVDERYRETPQQHIRKQQRNSGVVLETEHLGEKKSPECYGTSATQEVLGTMTMSSMENAFLHLRHIEFRTTELYVYYS